MHIRGNARLGNRAAAGKAVLPVSVERLLNLEWPSVRAEPPTHWFALYPYCDGRIIQAGLKATTASVNHDPKPAAYVLPNMLLEAIRTPDTGSLHGHSAFGEPRIRGHAAAQWLARFDVPPEELLAYKAKLLTEPKLTKETTLPGRI